MLFGLSPLEFSLVVFTANHRIDTLDKIHAGLDYFAFL